MKKYLLPKDGNFYKANLHCHTTISDGCLTPEEVKEFYKSQGYSIVAYTDHDVMIPHHDLRDDNFLPLTGFEMEINENFNDDCPPMEFIDMRVCHLCFIALDEATDKQIMFNPGYCFGNGVNTAKLVKPDEKTAGFERKYTHESINEMIKTGRDNRFFVTYNHPAWSLESYPEYIGYEGMNAMEIFNSGSVIIGYSDYSAHVYDDMLRASKRLYCIAADDNHNRHQDSRDCDSFGGCTMIKADKLEYSEITKALSDGNFYATQGPEIKNLWFEDGKIHIDCSPAEKIICTVGRRRMQIKWAHFHNCIDTAEFEILPEDKYVRLTIVDSYGRCADTNAYFTDELF